MKQTTTTSRNASAALMPRQAGQSLPEFLIVVPVFLFLVLLIFQLALVYRAKTTLDYATLQAARAGAVNGASLQKMRAGLARGLTPLYATSSGAGGVAQAWLEARADLILNADIQIINPTQAAWDEFKERQYNGEFALPNDNLAFRSHEIGSSGVNVQDANILKIKVTYDCPLIVPFVDLVMRGDSDYVRNDGGDVAMKLPAASGPVLGNHYRIPLESHAIIRMQSPIYEGVLAGGPGGPDGPGGPGGPGTGGPGPGGPGPGWPGTPDPGNPLPEDPGPDDPPVCSI